MLVLLLLLVLCAGGLAAVLARTYDLQLQGLAKDRLQRDIPLFRSNLNQLRVRAVELVQLVADSRGVIDGASAHDAAALDKILGPLRSQTAPGTQVLAVLDTRGQIIATDPFTSLNFANDAPVKESLRGRAVINPATTPNVAFWVRAGSPALSIEAAWPVRSSGKLVGSVVAVGVVGDGVLDGMLNAAELQAAIVAPQQHALLAASSQLRQLVQQQKLPGLLDNLSQKDELFRQATTGGDEYYFLQTPFPSQPTETRVLLAVPGRSLTAAAATLRRQLALVALAALVILAALGFGLLHWALAPVRTLTRGARRVAADKLPLDLSRTAPPELRTIAAALSALASDLATTSETEFDERKRIEAILESLPGGIVLSDANRRVTLVNPVAKRLLGIDGGDSTAALMPLDPIGELTANSKVIKSHSAPIVMKEGCTAGYVTLLHDASEEAALDRLKSEFVGLVSHELRTPLTSIKGSVDLLLDAETGDLNPTQRRFLGTIRRSSDRLINLVNDLLDLSRLEAGRVQLDVHPVDAGHLAEDTANSLSNLFAAKRQSMRIDCEPHLPPILADRQRMEQVLINLLGNAAKYTPEGGEIRLTVRRASDTELASDRASLDIAVADTGPGLSPEDQVRIFEKFYRAGDRLTDQQQTGSGLGLTIARSLVELHCGKLTVRSEVGRGSTFTIVLPVYEEEE